MNGRPTIIGCGTPDRGDDAAGLLVARRLRELGIDALEHSRDGAALIELWAASDAVILIDAVVSGRPAGTLVTWNSGAEVIPDAFRSTHAFGVAEAIGLARALGRMPAAIEIHGIEAAQFEIGAAASPEVAAAAERLAGSIARSYRQARH